MVEHDPQIVSYVHLNTYPRADEALKALKKISSLVKPIMRKRRWILPTLAEFFPAQQSLLGININHGQKICLRLRYAGDNTQFMPLEQVVDTMLHELSHNVHGPHDAAFHALWNELRDEYQDLVMKGYTGEGFIGQGSRLGGRNIPMREMRRQARASAERRKILSGGSCQKLGGAPVLRGSDMRQVIADAAARRTSITQGCASNTKQGDEIANQEARNGGFRTKAEEADANDRAIAEALWELVQEDEARKAGLPPGVWKTENLIFNPNTGFEIEGPPVPYDSKPPLPSSRSSGPSDLRRPSPLQLPQTKPYDENVKPSTGNRQKLMANPATTSLTDSWPCPVCTLVNPARFLACDACGNQRSPAPEPKAPPTILASRPVSSTVSKPPLRPHAGPNPKRKLSHFDLVPPKKLGWNCRRCGSFMEHQWWTCSMCGIMKDSSA